LTVATAEQRLIDAYLAPFDPRARDHSTLDVALRDARPASLREVADGTPMRPDHSSSWLGAVGYLILLDQLGETIRAAGEPVDRFPNRHPTVRKCLERFAAELTDDDTAAIYGLRCALAHDFGLWNPPNPGETPKPWHRVFTLKADDSNDLITHPARQWDGSVPVGAAGLRAFDMATTVNLRRLVGRIEELVADVRALGAKGKLEIALDNPIDLELRFRMRVVRI
jgi:hypothetical protein